MKKIITILLVGITVFQMGFAQEVLFTNFKFTDGVTQFPALTGSSGGSIYASNCTGLGLSGAGKSQSLGTHFLFSKQRLGLGVSVYHEQLNVLENYHIALQKAYHLPLGKQRFLSFGLSSEANLATINTNNLIETDLTDIELTRNRAWLIDFVPSFAFHGETFKIAFAHNRVLTSLNREIQNTYLTSYTNLLALYKWKVSSNLTFEPSYTLRYSEIQQGFRNDIQLMTTIAQQYFVGATWRSEQVINASVGMQIAHRYVVGYTYQSSLGELTSLYGANTHEITLRYN
ncbi:MAG: type IX secretion system membrane protein PorP/SprF, partial [Cytophagales bacterium]|nr:type IX secretion system membrane protein PorP/SprF [Cytophagales bacterium]